MLPTIANPNDFEIYRMVPPGDVQFFFVIDKQVCVSTIHPQQKFRQRIFGGASNYLHDAPSIVNVFKLNRSDLVFSNICNPRTVTPSGRREADDWFLKSVFVSYLQDSASHLREAFEYDWNISRVCSYCHTAFTNTNSM